MTDRKKLDEIAAKNRAAVYPDANPLATTDDERDAQSWLDLAPSHSRTCQDAFVAGRKGMVCASEVKRLRALLAQARPVLEKARNECKLFERAVQMAKADRDGLKEDMKGMIAEAVRSERERLKFEADQYIQAYAADFFNEPPGFKPKLDMNSAAIVRFVLRKIFSPPQETDGVI